MSKNTEQLDPANAHFSNWMQTRMEACGLSQADITRATGIQGGRLSEWSRGVRIPHVARIFNLCSVLGPYTIGGTSLEGAVEWIALNDNPAGEGANELDLLETTMTVLLVADIFGVSARQVAAAVIEHRTGELPTTGCEFCDDGQALEVDRDGTPICAECADFLGMDEYGVHSQLMPTDDRAAQTEFPGCTWRRIKDEDFEGTIYDALIDGDEIARIRRATGDDNWTIDGADGEYPTRSDAAEAAWGQA